MDIDLERFFRNIRLKTHFAQERDYGPKAPVDVVAPSVIGDFGTTFTYLPPKNSHPDETFIFLVKKEMEEFYRNIDRGDYHIQNNLTNEEKGALKELLGDKSLIVKPADKGGSIVIMNRPMYVKEIERQLSDSDTYEKIQHDPTIRVKRRIYDVVS